MTDAVVESRDDAATEPQAIAAAFISKLDDALAQRDLSVIEALWTADGWWRDLLALTWDIRSMQGHQQITTMLEERLEASGFRELALDPDVEVALVEPDPSTRWIQGFITFKTDVAHGQGAFKLVPEGDAWKATAFLTDAKALIGHEERRTVIDDLGAAALTEAEEGRKSWAERRREEQEFLNAEPTVLIVGAGQSGLATAARLGRLGVRALIVERNARVGDNWRNRYQNLNLHDPFWTNHFPYLPFPEHWPVVTPKDKLADWLEFYASAMDLNVWTGSEVVDGSFDAEAGRWTVKVRRADGDERTLQPSHVVIATGHSGVPNVPDIPGMDRFRGEIRHSHGHPGAEGWAGKKAIVVGTGSSGHDVAQDFYEHGADTTIVQRGKCYVMTLKNGSKLLNAPLYSEDAPPTEQADILAALSPWPVVVDVVKSVTPMIREMDKDVVEGLEKVGFVWDEEGLLSEPFGKGYYIDQGCSQLIADGKIKLQRGSIERFTETGVVFDDGTELEADIVVLCTGYKDLRENARALFGDEVADRLVRMWDWDAYHELGGIWRDSGHPHLFFMVGSLAWSRFYSRHVALQIKALEEGLYAQASATGVPAAA